MKWLWFMQFFSPEGDGGGGDPPGGDPAGGDDSTGLKSALQKEREARRAAEQRAKTLETELGSTKTKLTSVESAQAELAAKLTSFETKERLGAAVEKAVAKLGDGFVVDRDKVSKLAARMSFSEKIDEEVEELVSTVATKKAGARVVNGQPTREQQQGGNGGGGGDKPSLTELHRTNPEGFQAARAQVVQGAKFMAKPKP